jgi:hypothetical protein
MPGWRVDRGVYLSSGIIWTESWSFDVTGAQLGIPTAQQVVFGRDLASLGVALNLVQLTVDF